MNEIEKFRILFYIYPSAGTLPHILYSCVYMKRDKKNVSLNYLINQIFMCQLWIYHTREPPWKAFHVNLKSAINWTSTYRRDSDILNLYGRWVYYDQRVTRSPPGSPVDLNNFAANKTRKVQIFNIKVCIIL